METGFVEGSGLALLRDEAIMTWMERGHWMPGLAKLMASRRLVMLLDKFCPL
jgi:hypothetical protein